MREFFVANPCHNFFKHVESMHDFFVANPCHNFLKHVEPMREFFVANPCQLNILYYILIVGTEMVKSSTDTSQPTPRTLLSSPTLA